MSEERIKALEEQVVALQTALSLVLSPEHRKIVHTDDLRETLKELLKDEQLENTRFMDELLYRQSMMEQQKLGVKI